MNRRSFFQRVRGAGPVTLSCERLYIRYLEAQRIGRVAEMVTELRGEVGSASEVRLTDRGWLSRDEFRQAVAAALLPGQAVSSSRPAAASGDRSSGLARPLSGTS